MIGAARLALHAVVAQVRAGASLQLGDDAGEVLAVAAVALDHAGLRRLFEDDQVARMDRLAPSRARSEVEDLDRTLEHDAARHHDQRAVAKERGVERGERMMLEVDVCGRDDAATSSEPAAIACRRQPATAPAGSDRIDVCSAASSTVDEDEPIATGIGGGFDLGRGHDARVLERLEVAPHQRRDVGEAPVFVGDRREADLREPPARARPQRGHRVGSLPAAGAAAR